MPEGSYQKAIRDGLALAVGQVPARLPASEVDRICDSILRRDASQQALLLRNSRKLHRLEVCEGLLERGWAERFSNPHRLLETCRLVVRIAESVDSIAARTVLWTDMRALSWCHLANAQRVVGDFLASEEAFETAESNRLEGSGDPLLEAWLASRRAELHEEQKQLEDAIRCNARAYRLYSQLGDRHLAGGTLLALGRIYGEKHDLAKAIRCLYRGGSMVDAKRSPSLAVAAVHNLILYLDEAGHTQEALALLQEARPLYRTVPGEVMIHKLQWLEGRLSLSLGDLEGAIATLDELRQTYIDKELFFDSASVSLDLAVAYAEAHRFDELEELAEEMYPVFVSRQIPRDAIATLMLFCHAVEAKTVTAASIREMIQHLDKAEAR